MGHFVRDGGSNGLDNSNCEGLKIRDCIYDELCMCYGQFQIKSLEGKVST